MNKKNKFLLVLLILFIICTTIYFFTKQKTYNEITFKEYTNLLEKNDKFVLFIGSSKCSHCNLYKKTINEVINKYNIKIYYIDIVKLSKKEYAHLNSYFPFSGTPTTIVIENKEEYKREKTRIDGDQNYKTIVEKLTNAKIIK